MGVGEEFLTEFSFCALKDKKVVAVSGITEMWEGRGVAWFYSRNLTKRDWVEITRLVEGGIKEAMKKFRRIEIAVVEQHRTGRNWAKRLGFQYECRAESYTPNGNAAWLYSIVRDDGRAN